MSGLALSHDGDERGPGFYGKVPARGDFVGRRLPRSFLDPWDEWVQAAIDCSREQLGDEWLPAYLTCPVWRFALSAGVCGPAAAAGIVMPSVDRVGRYFPLVLAAPLPGCDRPAALAARGGDWLDGLERLALSALEDGFDLERFDDELSALGLPAVPPAEAMAQAPPAGSWRIALSSADPAGVYAEAVDRLLRARAPCYGLWWTASSERIEPSLLICDGLPRIAGYAALLDGAWERWGWEPPSGPAGLRSDAEGVEEASS